MTAPANGIWFALAGFVLASFVVAVIETRARRRRRRGGHVVTSGPREDPAAETDRPHA